MSLKSLKLLTFTLLLPCFFGLSVQAIDADDELAEMAVLVKGDLAKIKADNPSTGRQSLMALMEKSPSLIAKDIKRINFIDVGKDIFRAIGFMNPTILQETLTKKTAMDGFNLVTDEIVKEINIKDGSRTKTLDPKKLGKFFKSEIMFAMTQDMLVDPEVKAFFDQGEFFSKWGSRNEPKGFATVTYDPSTGILTVSRINQKLLSDLSDTSEKSKVRKKYSTTTATNFNLKTGEVTYTLKYDVDGVKKEWKVDELMPPPAPRKK